MRRVTAGCWSLLVPTDWIVQHDPERLTLVHPSEQSALQICAYGTADPVQDEDLLAFAAANIDRAARPVPTTVGDFSGFAMEMPTEDDLAVCHWLLRHATEILVVTCTHEVAVASAHGADLADVLGSLSLTPAPPAPP